MNELTAAQQKADQWMKARSQQIWKHFGPTWLNNVRKNIPQINETAANHQLEDAFKRAADRIDSDQVLIFAPGASLKQWEPYMKELAPKLQQAGIIIATPTVLNWLRMHGVEPTILMASDSSPLQTEPLKVAPSTGNMMLLVPPLVDRSLVKAFPRSMVYWYNSLIMDEDGGVEGLDYNEFMLMLLQPLHQFIVQAGSVTNQAVIAARSAIDTGIISAQRIVLIGADYAYHGGNGRVPMPLQHGETEDGEPVWYCPVYPGIPVEPDSIMWDGMPTNRRMVVYKKNLLYYWWATKSPIYSCSEGILNEFPYVSLFDIADNKYPEYLNKDEMREMAYEFLEVQFPQEFSALFDEELQGETDEGRNASGYGKDDLRDPRQIRVESPARKELL